MTSWADTFREDWMELMGMVNMESPTETSIPSMMMNRIVRDMSKKLGKRAKLTLIGEDTEVDKTGGLRRGGGGGGGLGRVHRLILLNGAGVLHGQPRLPFRHPRLL